MSSKGSRKYFQFIDILRIISCIFVLLYHLKIVKGGYLAVCSFFVLSGYLSCVSSFNKENFSIKSYYKNIFKRIYLPLLLVVFLTIGVVSFFPNIAWVNLKRETISILFNYNNFWQLNANLDYFSKNVDSPFIHLWYISILIQFDLVFPFIFLLFKNISDRVHKVVAPLFTFVIAVSLTLIFYTINLTKGINIVYYNTFTRIFSLIFGLSLGFYHSYYKPLIFNKYKLNYLFYSLYMALLLYLFIQIDSSSNYFALSMILTTIVTCRLVDYSLSICNIENNTIEKIIKYISNISYEVYLVQYPVIFLFQYININHSLKIISIIITTIVISCIINKVNNKSTSQKKIIKLVIRPLIIMLALYGVFIFNNTEDHSKEMKELENKLAENEVMMKQRQAEFELNYKKEEEALEEALKNIDNDVNAISNLVTNLPIIGIGDSVMLGAVPNLYSKFNNGYFDAKVSRTGWVVNDILLQLSHSNRLGNPVVLHLGTNGDCSDSCKKKIINTLNGKDIYLLTVTNDHNVNVNYKYFALEKEYDNIHVIDWNNISKGHNEYFGADGIHLTASGKEAYVNAIYEALYNSYLEKYNAKKEELIKTYESKVKDKISFYGNDILINVFDNINNEFSDSKFTMNKDYNYSNLLGDLKESKSSNTLTNKIVLAFDNKSNMSKEKYEDIINNNKDIDIYIVSLNEKVKLLDEYENVSVIDFSLEAQNSNYYTPDKVHFNEEGNKLLSSKIINALQEVSNE